MAEKTHDPTPKRLRDARDKGDVPKAPLLAGALGLALSLAFAPSIVRALIARFAASFADLRPVDRIEPWSIALPILALVVPLGACFVAVAFASAVAQGSLGFAPSRLAPDPSRLDPFGGLKNLFEKGRLWNAARGLFVALVLLYVLGRALFDAIVASARADGDLSAAFAMAAEGAKRAGSNALVVAGLFAVMDVVVSRRIWLGRLRMTRDEVVREHKEGDGDPELKRRREELHHELLAGEAIRAVRDATVVVVNPTHLACALRYRGESEDEAPTLVAKGDGALAARIVEAARVYGVPVVRDVPVARALHALEIGTEIPENLYEAVAELLRAAWDETGNMR